MSESPASIGARLKARRDELGLTREQVAAASGCCLSTYAAIERGKNTTTRTLTRVAETLGVNIDGTSLEGLSRAPRPPPSRTQGTEEG